MIRQLLLVSAAMVVSHIAVLAATITVNVVPSTGFVNVGQSFDVDVFADLPDPVLGWGLDLMIVPGLASAGPPAIGSSWSPVLSFDGDNLSGLAFPLAISGGGIKLFTVPVLALATGDVMFSVLATPLDFSEGFALETADFGDFVVNTGRVSIGNVPEPSTFSLVLSLLVVLGGSRARRAPETVKE